MMASGSAVQVKGLGLLLVSARYRLMAAWRSTMPLKTPRLSRCRFSLAKKPSTALSQKAEVGVKWKWKRLCRSSQSRTLGMLVRRVIVDNQMQFPPGRGLTVDLVEETDEFLVPMAGHALADNLAVQHIEGGEQRCCAVALVIVGHRPATAALHRQSRLGAVERLDAPGCVRGAGVGGPAGGFGRRHVGGIQRQPDDVVVGPDGEPLVDQDATGRRRPGRDAGSAPRDRRRRPAIAQGDARGDPAPQPVWRRWPLVGAAGAFSARCRAPFICKASTWSRALGRRRR